MCVWWYIFNARGLLFFFCSSSVRLVRLVRLFGSIARLLGCYVAKKGRKKRFIYIYTYIGHYIYLKFILVCRQTYFE
ncbi:hypothetical protein F4703DRAFT_1120245 [Phycomyces blakesleeanus]